MLFAKKKYYTDPSSAAGSYVLHAVLASLCGFALLDVIIAIGTGGSLLFWCILLLAELGITVGIAVYFHHTFLRLLEPLRTVVEVAERMKDASLNAAQLRALSRRLESIDPAVLGQQVKVYSSGGDIGILGDAINGMLSRLDSRYRENVEFVANASHELRTPITVIRGYADLLQRYGTDNKAAVEKSLSSIIDETNTMEALVDQILFLLRGDRGVQKVEIVPTDLSEITETIAEQTKMIRTKHTVLTEITPNITGNADPALIRECLRILTENAAKYTPEGGTITVGIRRENNSARIYVRDTGIGIPEESLPRLFERFYRVDDSRSRATGGSGLGLSIAKWIADRHDGTIQVSSVLNEGSTFALVIPLSGPAQTDAAVLPS